MVGIAEIGGALSGLKAAMEIAKGLSATANAVAINEAKIGLQSAILEAQAGLLAAQETETANLRRIDQLEQDIVRLKDWSAERQNYNLVNIDRGAFAYMPKPGMENSQPAHWLCANCFEQGHKSLLQFKGQGGQGSGGNANESAYGCDRCKATLKVHWRRKPSYPGEADA